MSFSANVKNEILNIKEQGKCCEHAFAYGLLLFSREFSLFDVSILTEHKGIADVYKDALISVCGVTPRVVRSEAGKFRVEVTKKSDRAKVLKTFGYDEKNGGVRLNWSNISDKCCQCAFLRGVFLACGTINDPNKRYHLEFVVPYLNLCKDLKTFIHDFFDDYDELEDYEKAEVIPKSVSRNSNYIVYFKDSESIERILTVMGACNATLEIMGIKMYKDMRNNVNRKLNFETANLDKTIDAAAKQIQAIEHIKATVGLNSLTEELRELARLRVENPDMSLRQLGEELTVPLSRSGVNHRLQKLCKISEEI